MKEILYNLALIDTINFCKAHNIDCSGSHLIKAHRGYTYTLVKSENKKPIVTVTFHKMQVPTHTIN